MTRHHTQAMRAIILHTHGGPDQLVPAEIPDPTPLRDEVVINPSVGWGDREDGPADGWAILGVPRQGTYAERIAMPADHVLPRPRRLSWHESAALPLAGLTAWRALVSRGRVEHGTRVLVTGAGGGAATFP